MQTKKKILHYHNLKAQEIGFQMVFNTVKDNVYFLHTCNIKTSIRKSSIFENNEIKDNF